MITLHIFSDIAYRYAFTNDPTGANLPVEGYEAWDFLQTRTFFPDERVIPTLNITANEIASEVTVLGFKIIVSNPN